MHAYYVDLPEQARRKTPISQRIRILQNMMQMSEKDGISIPSESYNRWLETIKNLEPTPIHRRLHETVFSPEVFNVILTLNYDYALEKELNFPIPSKDEDASIVRRCRVCHIHGHANSPESIIMHPEDYRRAVSEIENENLTNDKLTSSAIFDRPWIEAFCTREIHICGASMHTEEETLWYALKRRLEYIRSTPHDAPKGRCYVYLFCEKSKINEPSYFSLLLRSFCATPILIPVEKADYMQAWEKLIKRMKQIIGRNLPNTEEISDIFYSRHAGRNKNVSLAFVPLYVHAFRCRMSIPRTALQKMAEQGKSWCFYYNDAAERHMWKTDAQELLQALLPCETDQKDRYYLIINYRHSKVFGKIAKKWIKLDSVYLERVDELDRWITSTR